MANILELSPDAFMQAMEELGLPEGDQARLREQYRQKNSVFAGAKEALKPAEGRKTSTYAPISVPEGQSIAEGVTSGNWDWAVPEGLSGGVTSALEGIEAPGQILSGVPYSEQELQDAAWNTAGVAGAGSLAFDAPEGATRMFGGMKAKNFPWDRYDQYNTQKDAAMFSGKKFDEDLAWEDFGIEDTPETAIFQIDPAGAVAKTPAKVEKGLDQIISSSGKAVFDMQEVFEFPELFDNYPVLKNFKVSVRDKTKQGEPLEYGGWFDATNNEIVVGIKTAKDPEDFRTVMLHELQHGIQAVENISGGAAPRHFFREDPDTKNWVSNVDDLKEPVRKLNLLKDRVIDADINYGRQSETYKDLWNQYVEEYRAINKVAMNKYMTNPGEVQARAAQLWDQLSSEEKKTTRPSFVEKQAMGLLKKEYGDTNMPTARLSNNYAEGGMVQGTNMDNEMTKLFAEGGLNTGDAQVDPISGNEVPPGSMPEEVRDDVDAKLSGGEYVVPADVLRYYGVSFFEKLRKKAKDGLAEMDADGRIGGDDGDEQKAPEMEEDDDLPFNEDELMFEDEGGDMAFAEGGVVPPGGLKTFDPSQYAPGFSAFGVPPQQNIENKTYTNTQGQQTTIQFINGQPQQPIPAGYYPQGQVPPQTPAANPNTATANKPERPNADDRRGEQGTRTGTGGKGPEWASGKDWANMSVDDATALAQERLAGNKVMKGLGAAAGLLGPVAGLIGGAAANLRPYAEANAIEKVLRAQGNNAAADAVGAMTDSQLANAKVGTRMIEPMLANGSGIAKGIISGISKAPTTTAPAVRTAPVTAPAATGNSGAKQLAVRSKDDRGTGPAKDRSTISKGTAVNGKASASFSKDGKSAPAKSSGGGTFRGGRATGGLVERRKK